MGLRGLYINFHQLENFVCSNQFLSISIAVKQKIDFKFASLLKWHSCHFVWRWQLMCPCCQLYHWPCSPAWQPLPWASGNPVAIQCAWNSDPSVHWNATGEMPVYFQWCSSGFPVVFQCVPIMQINTGSPPGHHWVLASASVVPVASQCTCGSSGLPVCSNYAN